MGLSDVGLLGAFVAACELAGIEPGLDGGLRFVVPEFLEPLAVFGGLLDFYTSIVSYRLHHVKPNGRWSP